MKPSSTPRGSGSLPLSKFTCDKTKRDATFRVSLRVYDISCGRAASWSRLLLGRQIDGIWHTGINIYGYEYFYGGGIIRMAPPDVEITYGMTPSRIHHLGWTSVKKHSLENYLDQISKNFTRDFYDIVLWNCNNFSDHLALFLVGKGIPRYVIELPREIQSSLPGSVFIAFLKAFVGRNQDIRANDPLHPRFSLSSRTVHSGNEFHDRKKPPALETATNDFGWLNADELRRADGSGLQRGRRRQVTKERSNFYDSTELACEEFYDTSKFNNLKSKLQCYCKDMGITDIHGRLKSRTASQDGLCGAAKPYRLFGSRVPEIMESSGFACSMWVVNSINRCSMVPKSIGPRNDTDDAAGATEIQNDELGDRTTTGPFRRNNLIARTFDCLPTRAKLLAESRKRVNGRSVICCTSEPKCRRNPVFTNCRTDDQSRQARNVL